MFENIPFAEFKAFLKFYQSLKLEQQYGILIKLFICGCHLLNSTIWSITDINSGCLDLSKNNLTTSNTVKATG
jgi:hypothetical protein